MRFLKKPDPKDVSANGSVEFADEGFTDKYPALSEFLSSDRWDDGSARETGTMFLFVQLGRWKLMLKDRDRGMISFWTADSLSELFEAVDAALTDGRADWRADRKPAGRGRQS